MTETRHAVASRQDWLKARLELLALEKEETRLRDRINRERLALPWVAIDKPYRFATPGGTVPLAELFDGRSQLLVYHFMFGADWEAGCVGCSLMADHFDGVLTHLNNHDVSLVAVSSAPLSKLDAYRRRMGWRFPWVSSGESDFNRDFHVSFDTADLESGSLTYNYRQIPSEGMPGELPGLSAFYRDDSGHIFHTYSSYARGPEEAIGTLMLLDRAPLGRNEKTTMDWVRRHDEYEAPAGRSCCTA